MCFELSVSTITLILLWELLFMTVFTYNKYESLSPNDQSVRSSTDRLVFKTISGKSSWFKSSLLRDHEVVVFYWQLLQTVCKQISLLPRPAAACVGRPTTIAHSSDQTPLSETITALNMRRQSVSLNWDTWIDLNQSIEVKKSERKLRQRRITWWLVWCGIWHWVTIQKRNMSGNQVKSK